MQINFTDDTLDIRNPRVADTVRQIQDFMETHLTDDSKIRSLVIGEFNYGNHIPFTVSLFLNNGQLCYCKTPLEEDLSNWGIVCTKLCEGFNALLPEIDDMRETYSCEFNGRPTQFSRVFGTHYFTDEECQKLANGETIVFLAEKLDDGFPYVAVGKLEQQDYEGKNSGDSVIGFRRHGFKRDLSYRGLKPYHKRGQNFTQDELYRLYKGETIVHQFADEKQFTRSIRLRYDHDSDKIVNEGLL